MTENNKQDIRDIGQKTDNDRKARLAAELRSNLKKRKEYVRETRKNLDES